MIFKNVATECPRVTCSTGNCRIIFSVLSLTDVSPVRALKSLLNINERWRHWRVKFLNFKKNIHEYIIIIWQVLPPPTPVLRKCFSLARNLKIFSLSLDFLAFWFAGKFSYIFIIQSQVHYLFKAWKYIYRWIMTQKASSKYHRYEKIPSHPFQKKLPNNNF